MMARPSLLCQRRLDLARRLCVRSLPLFSRVTTSSDDLRFSFFSYPYCLTYDVLRYTLTRMIHSFECADTHSLFIRRKSKRWNNILSVALRKLDQLNAAAILEDLRVPPGNRLESLKGDRRGRHSIRINDQWRICFVWKTDGAYAPS